MEIYYGINGFLGKIENHKKYATYLEQILKYNKIEDWYNITVDDIWSNHGGGLLCNYYKNSAILFVQTMFSTYIWLEWKFNKVTRNYWDDIDNHKKYASYLGEN